MSEKTHNDKLLKIVASLHMLRADFYTVMTEITILLISGVLALIMAHETGMVGISHVMIAMWVTKNTYRNYDVACKK